MMQTVRSGPAQHLHIPLRPPSVIVKRLHSTTGLNIFVVAVALAGTKDSLKMSASTAGKA